MLLLVPYYRATLDIRDRGARRSILASSGVGARVRRKEDSRFLYGEGQYIGDMRFPRMRDVAFVRSPVAHARLKAVLVPEHLRSSVFIAGDLVGVLPLRAVS